MDPGITDLLSAWNSGDRTALDRLTPLVYGELHRIAGSLMHQERGEHILQATALVHEAYLRLVDARAVDWQGRAHFFGAAANQMRRVLIDHARKRMAAKRDSYQVELTQPGIGRAAAVSSEELLELDQALDRLETIDPRKVKVIEMKFFSGMTNTEIAHVLAVSDATVERDWKMARAWLIRSLSDSASPPGV
jgi:RNA polymerase sigma factor (TIGR02999 family)